MGVSVPEHTPGDKTLLCGDKSSFRFCIITVPLPMPEKEGSYWAERFMTWLWLLLYNTHFLKEPVSQQRLCVVQTYDVPCSSH